METLENSQFGKSEIPKPDKDERPTEYADRMGVWYVKLKSDDHRKEHGLYLTPVAVADFMAEGVQLEESGLRILDPAAGSGILSCAAVETLVSKNSKLDAIELVAYEVDETIVDYLHIVLKYLSHWCEHNYGVRVTIQVERTDFILAHDDVLQEQEGLLARRATTQKYDVVICNPPYFKLNKADPRVAVASTVVHGQPNIYALFMAISAALLRRGGEFVFITPRSFVSGFYFRQFRSFFFNLIHPTAVHVFGSRRDAFSRDDVLQENIIFFGERHDNWSEVPLESPLTISSSNGVRDIGERNSIRVSMNVALDLNSLNKVLRLPLSHEEEEILDLVDSWQYDLQSLELKISTGPVVPFRATALLDKEGKVPSSHVPLLWMNHVQAMQTTWPINRHKLEYIKRTGAQGLLVPNKNYVLLRRFSSKEQPRRLTAAPYIAEAFAIPEVGLENHLNYIQRPSGVLSNDEAMGLAALYNSRILDTYFRAVNGNTQVSATELRSIPLPSRETIVALGRGLKRSSDPMQHIDHHLMAIMRQPELMEVSVG